MTHYRISPYSRAVLTALSLLVACATQAHFINPQGNIFGIRDQFLTVGDTFETSVQPSSASDTCTVKATVTVGDSAVLEGGGTKTEKFPKFTLTAKKAGKTTVTVYFEGLENEEGFDCPAMREEIYTVEVKARASTASQSGSGSDADPVNTFSGELYMDAPGPDIALDGPMPLVFQRYYGSYLRRAFVVGDLGNNWRHNFDTRLQWNGTRALFTTWKGKVTTFNKEGDLWVQADNLEVPYQLIADAGDVRLLDPEDERVYTFDYSTGGPVTSKLISVEDGKGNAHDLAYDEDGQLLSVSDGLGRELVFTYKPLTEEDQIRKIQSVSDGTRTVTFQYLDAIDGQNLTDVFDARGGVTTYSYEDTAENADHALLLTQRRPEGNIPFTQAFYSPADGDESGRVKWQIDGLGNITNFSYDVAGGVTTVSDPGGETSREHTHSSAGKLLQHEDESGASITLGYDDAGRRANFNDRDGNAVQTSYHGPSGYPASVTHEDGSTTLYTYATRVLDGFEWYDLAGVTFPDGTAETFAYDANGNATSMLDRSGDEWLWTYNNRGQMLTETNPSGGVSSYVYNADGTLERSTDADGVTMRFEYDALFRPVRVIREDGSDASTSYDAHDNVTGVTDELDNTTSYLYDRNDNLLRVTDAAGGETNYSYDAMDRLVSVQDTEDNTTAFLYDERGRLTTVTHPDGSVSTTEYDGLSRVVAASDASGRRTTFEYSTDGALQSVTDANENTTTFSNDANKDPLTITSPRGFSTTLERDAEGRVTRSTDALDQVTDITLDDNGQPSNITLPGAVVSGSYDRDALGLLTEVTDANGNSWSGTRSPSGHLYLSTDPLGRARTATLDDDGRLGQRTFAGGLGSVTLSYDAADRLTGKSFSDGESVSLTYDALGRLTGATGTMITGDRDAVEPGFAPLPELNLAYDGATDWLTDSNGLVMTRDSRGRMATLAYTPGRVVTYGYDGAGRLVSLQDWNGVTTLFIYDGAGRRSSIIRPNGVITTYSYDDDDNITRIVDGAVGAQLSDLTLTRDALGRVVDAQRDTPLGSAGGGASATDSYLYDSANQVLGFSYDAEGRLLADSERSYSWNLDSQLRSIAAEPNLEYSYDALGALVGRREDSGNREFVWNYATPLPTLATERRDGSDYRYYIYEPDGSLVYSINAAGSRRDYHFDEGGNTIFLSDESGQITHSYAYVPYGGVAASAGSADNPFTWRGQSGVWHETAAGGGLYYMRARWYDAQSMRFLSEDPAQLTGPIEMHRYAYAALDPLQNDDPSGLEPKRRTKHGSASCPSSCACKRGGFQAPPVGLSVLKGKIWGTVFLGSASLVERAATGNPGTFSDGLNALWGAKPSPRKKRGVALKDLTLILYRTRLGAWYRGKPVWAREERRPRYACSCGKGKKVGTFDRVYYYIGENTERSYTARELANMDLEWERDNWQKAAERKLGICEVDRTLSEKKRRDLTEKYRKAPGDQ